MYYIFIFDYALCSTHSSLTPHPRSVLLGDLLRFLRHYDDDEKSFCRQLADQKILNNHLLPMLAAYRTDEALVEPIGPLHFPAISFPR